MSEEFFNIEGYEIPEEVGEVKAESSFEYYRHPIGTYMFIFGRLIPKYKDISGKKCEADDATAHMSHFIAQLWVTRFLKPGSQQAEDILKIEEKEIVIPNEKQAAELYYPLFISIEPSDQWRVHKMFESFNIPGYDQYKIVRQNPDKPTEKTTKFKNFPFYYGMQGKFILSNYRSKAGKESIIMSDIEIIAQMQKVDAGIMHKLELNIQDKMKEEFESRQSQNDNYTPDTPPSANDIMGENLGEYE